jgi:hypothetical protein
MILKENGYCKPLPVGFHLDQGKTIKHLIAQDHAPFPFAKGCEPKNIPIKGKRRLDIFNCKSDVIEASDHDFFLT